MRDPTTGTNRRSNPYSPDPSSTGFQFLLQIEEGEITTLGIGESVATSSSGAYALGMNPPPVQLIHPRRFGDSRGWFTEAYSERTAAQLGIDARFVQDNHSLSAPAFTLRGLHYQLPPHDQAKLIRCLRGRIFDVAVDVRRESPTYGRWVGAQLTAEEGNQLFVSSGFAHGFLTLEPNCEVAYKVSAFYEPRSDGGIRWDSVAIEWPLPAGRTPEMSDKDGLLPALADFDSPFSYDGRPLEPLT